MLTAKTESEPARFVLAHSAPSLTQAANAETELAPIRVVLIDDHCCMLWGLEKLIESAAPRLKTVATATNSADATACVESQQPDIVVLNLQLEDTAIIDLIPRFVRSGHTRVIVLTGTNDRESRERAVMAGARGLLHKSEPVQNILKAIEKVHAGQLWLDAGTITSVFAALSGRQRKPDAPRHAALTSTEAKIVSAVVKHKGAPNKVIARSLHISDHTLRNHLASIYSKLGVHRRLDLVLLTLERGFNDSAY